MSTIFNMAEVVDIGIEFEKDAILFFRSLGLFLTPGRREIIERLVGEEKSHLVYLLKLRKSYPV